MSVLKVSAIKNNSASSNNLVLNTDGSLTLGTGGSLVSNNYFQNNQSSFGLISATSVSTATNSGSYTVPSGVNALGIILAGAGGGGGGGGTGQQNTFGGFGGMPGVVGAVFTTTPGTSYSYALGSGGTGGGNGGGNMTAGTDSWFDGTSTNSFKFKAFGGGAGTNTTVEGSNNTGQRQASGTGGGVNLAGSGGNITGNRVVGYEGATIGISNHIDSRVYIPDYGVVQAAQAGVVGNCLAFVGGSGITKDGTIVGDVDGAITDIATSGGDSTRTGIAGKDGVLVVFEFG
jgi:hypothetical protein